MQVNGVTATAVTRLRSTRQTADASASNAQRQVDAVLARMDARRQARIGVRLQEKVADLTRVLQYQPARLVNPGTAAAVAIGSSSLNLSNRATHAELSSSEALNTQSTRYDSSPVDWSGPSSASPSISGTYDGSQGTGDLTFTITQAGIRGTSDAMVRVTDTQDQLLETITLKAADPTSTQYTLSNGLQFSTAGGVLVLGGEFTLAVATDLNLQPNPDGAFNDASAAGANLDPGTSIVDGAFTLNGFAINVAANDTVNSIISRINSSGAAVDAQYNAATEQLELTQQNPGSNFDIALANDTSGILAALKLDSVNVIAGTNQELTSTLDQVPAFAGVSSGSLLVNGQGIDIDVAVDSVIDILNRINSVDPSVDSEILPSQQVSIRGAAGEPLTLDSNGTGLFESLFIDSDTYIGSSVTSAQYAGVVAYDVAQRTTNLVTELNTLFRAMPRAELSPGLSKLQAGLDTLIAEQLVKPLEQQNVYIGLRQRSRLGTSPSYGSLNVNSLVHGLVQRSAAVNAVFLGGQQNIYTAGDASGSKPTTGFLPGLIELLQTTLLSSVPRGSLIDVYT